MSRHRTPRSVLGDDVPVNPCRLHIIGASGSGTTTLGRAVASAWSVPVADSDDYFWVPTDPPFVTARPVPERIALMQQMFLPRHSWVLTGSMGSWGESVADQAEAIVFLTIDPAERMRRLEVREGIRRGVPVPDDPAWTEFRDWARSYDDPEFEGRSRSNHEAWLEKQDRPVLRLDSSRPLAELVDAVLGWDLEIPRS